MEPDPAQLRAEADASERLAAVVSYAPDKQWLMAKARELRHRADRIEQTSMMPRRQLDRGHEEPPATGE